MEERFWILKKHLDDLRNKEIVDTGSRTFTEFDVLLYMCHGDNWHNFPEIHQVRYGGLQDQRRDLYGSESVKSDVNEILKFFKNFAFQLSTFDKSCPDEIKSKVSTEIFEMGKTIYPFMTKTRQTLIEKVLKYFGCALLPSRCKKWCKKIFCERKQCCFPCRQTQNTPGYSRYSENIHESENERVLSTPEPSSREEEASEGLISYPGHDEIKCAIPYIEYFKYEDGEMTCHIPGTDLCIQNHEILFQCGISAEKDTEIRNEIETLWPGEMPDGNLLHLIRMVMYMSKTESNKPSFFQDHKYQSFIEFVKTIVYSQYELSKKAVTRQCMNAIQDISSDFTNLSGAHKHLLKDIRTRDLLQGHSRRLRDFMMEMLKEQETDDAPVTTQEDMSPSQSDLHAFNDFPDPGW